MNYLVAVDFSSNSQRAADFAASHIGKSGGLLHLLHIIRPAEDETGYLPVKTVLARTNTVYEMFTYQESLRKKFGIRSDCSIIPGEFLKQVRRIAREEKSDVIVVGAQGESGLRRHLFGGNVSALMIDPPLPLMVVPEKAPENVFRRVVFYAGEDDAAIRLISSFQHFAAGVTNLTIVAGSNRSGRISTNPDVVKEQFPSVQTDFRFIDLQDNFSAVLSLVKTQSPDLLVIPSYSQDLIEKVSGRSVYQEAGFDFDVPLLILP